MEISTTKCFTFEACHHLPDYDGKCANIHGHSYKLEVTVSGYIHPDSCMVVDFSELKDVVNACIIEKFDHKDLNTMLPMPTAELIALGIYNDLRGIRKLNSNAIRVSRIKLWETADSYVEINE